MPDCMHHMLRPVESSQAAHLHASNTAPEVKRQGSGAYLVAMMGRVLVSRMNSPRNCSLRPKPYTYTIHNLSYRKGSSPDCCNLL